MIKAELTKRRKTDDDLRGMFERDDKEFRDFVFLLSMRLLPGRITSLNYAACVAGIAKYLKVDYEAYTGYMVFREDKDSKDNVEKFKKDMNSVLANGVCIRVNKHIYECIDGKFDNIVHVKVVKI